MTVSAASVATHELPPWQTTRGPLWLGSALLLALFGSFVLYLGSGPMPIPLLKVLASLIPALPWPEAQQASPAEAMIVCNIRLPRALMATAIGAGLAVSGAAMQGLFRNPLADPGLLGVSAGAALAAVSWIVFGAAIAQIIPALNHPYSLPFFAFAGSAITSLMVFYMASRRSDDVAVLLLTGIAINAICGALTGLMVYLANDDQLRTFSFWTMGSLANSSAENLSLSAPFILGAILVSFFFSRALNAQLLGESEARHMGYSPQRLKLAIIITVSLSVGAAVAFCGMIGFVGLVVPHLIRLLNGPDHSTLLPASAALGAILLLGADGLARTLAVPAEVPIGLLTASLGGPFFLWLIARQRSERH